MPDWTPEPWDARTHAFPHERFVELERPDYERARACVNALAGIPDPAAALERVRDELNRADAVCEQRGRVGIGYDAELHCIIDRALRALTPTPDA